MDDATRREIQATIDSHPVVLFMKGNPAQPQCGFSARVVGILNTMTPDYATVDVLQSPSIREGIKEFSNWPTIPQLYVKGELVGGCDIITEMNGRGELAEALGVELPEPTEPEIRLSAGATAFLENVVSQHPESPIRITIDARFGSAMDFDEKRPTDVSVTTPNGLEFVLDRLSASRGDGLEIDVVESLHGTRLEIRNPNDAKQVREISATAVKKLFDEGADFDLLDVRGDDEIAVASIAGAVQLTEDVGRQIESAANRDRMLVFVCHHGIRSRAAAEYFRQQGFRNVHNLVGGIDAWSAEVEPAVPRY